jgi:hypothetical protein
VCRSPKVIYASSGQLVNYYNGGAIVTMGGTTTTASTTTVSAPTTVTLQKKRKKIRLTYENLAPNLLIDGILPPGQNFLLYVQSRNTLECSSSISDEPSPRPPGPPLSASRNKNWRLRQRQRQIAGAGGRMSEFAQRLGNLQAALEDSADEGTLGNLESTNVMTR